MGATSASCSMVCRCTHSCGRGSAKASGRTQAGLFFEELEELPLGRGFSGISAAYCISFPPSPTLDMFRSPWGRKVRHLGQGHRGIRSCRSHERSRRCRRIIAAPAACSSLPRNDHVKSITKKKKGHTKTMATLENLSCCCSSSSSSCSCCCFCCCCFRR